MNNDIFNANLKDLYFSKFTFNVEVTKDIYLSQNKGSTFRGGFGNAFKKFVCFNPIEKDCELCMLKSDCHYYKIFQNKLDDKAVAKFGISGFAPRPYILEPPNTIQQKFTKDERFSFNLILVGWATQYLPYFTIIVENLGEILGLGKRINGSRGKFKLLNIINNGNKIYSGKTKQIKIELIKELNIKDLSISHLSKPGNINKIKLNFITPTRIEVNKKRISLNEERNFKTFILRLYKRLFLLQEFYCNGEQHEYIIDKAGEMAEQVKLINSKLYWNDLYRWKYKKNGTGKELMKMGGFTGKVTFEGNIKPFLNIIRLGEYLHVGKHYTFGLGKYEVLI